MSQVQTRQVDLALLLEHCGQLLNVPVRELVVRKVQLLKLAVVHFENLQQRVESRVGLSEVILGQVERDEAVALLDTLDQMLESLRGQSVISQVQM